MSAEFTVQCQSCGTVYNDLQDVCPYCGEPQPDSTELAPVFQEPVLVEPPAQPDPGPPLEAWAQEELPEEDFSVTESRLPPGIEEYLTPAAYQEPVHDSSYPEALTEDDLFGDDGFYRTQEEPDPYPDELAYEDDLYPEETYEEVYQPDPHWASPALYPGYQEQHIVDGVEFSAVNPHPAANRFTWPRILLGCLGMLLCLGLTYGTIGLLAVRAGLQERALLIQTDSEAHYQKGQEHLSGNSIDLAVAEFEMALSINPNFPAARQALREAQRIAQTRPTPTSETRSAAAADIFSEAERLVQQEDWEEAIQTLLQVRDLDPNYQAESVSEWLYTANYTLGTQFLNPEQADEALAAFENALAERPDDSEAKAEQVKVSLYLEGLAAEADDKEKAVDLLYRLYRNDPAYLDVEQRLLLAYEALGDELVEAEEWCLAQAQYSEALAIQTEEALQDKLDEAEAQCQNSPVAQRVVATPRPTPAGTSAATAAKATPAAADFEAPASPATAPVTTGNTPPKIDDSRGRIFFSDFNPDEQRWEILSVPVAGGLPELVVPDAVMPAISPNGQLLLYRSELGSAEGLHALNLATGEKVRITTVREHILPRWGGDNLQFLFVAQEGTGRWLIQENFADGKSNSIILQDGRTPDWSGDGQTIAFQGTDPQGNNPGIYLAPFGGGESTRLTNHESDRMPIFSPDNSQVAYMSTRDGNWNIYVVNTAGSAPRQITSHPGNDGLPVWSPDGSQLAYVSDAGGNWGIYVVNAAGGTPAKVADWDGRNHPDWLMAQIDWK